VGDAPELQVFHIGRRVVDKQCCAIPPDEELLQGEDLTSVAELALGEQPQLGE